MKLKYNFKDGIVCESPDLGHAKDMIIEGENVDFLTTTIKGIKNNSSLNFDGLVKKYEDLHSIEIIFD